jgi:hypothetical protein
MAWGQIQEQQVFRVVGVNPQYITLMCRDGSMMDAQMCSAIRSFKANVGEVDFADEVWYLAYLGKEKCREDSSRSYNNIKFRKM